MEWKSSSKRKTSILRNVLVAAFVFLFIGAITFAALQRTSSPFVALDEHPAIPEEYVKDVLAHVFTHEEPSSTSNSTRGLRKRVPGDVKCRKNDLWLKRHCDGDRSQSAWLEYCAELALKPTREPAFYQVKGSCLPEEDCAPHLTESGREIIVCALRKPKHEFILVRFSQQKMGPVWLHRDSTNPSGTEQEVPLLVRIDMDGGTASGFLSDSTSSYIIAPWKPLVGHVRGVSVPLC